MYGQVVHAWDSDAYQLGRQRDEIDRLRARVLALETEAAYTVPVTSVRDEVRDGYRYPDDWNAACREFNYPEGIEPEPTRGERIARAIEWGLAALREKVARAIEPSR